MPVFIFISHSDLPHPHLFLSLSTATRPAPRGQRSYDGCRAAVLAYHFHKSILSCGSLVCSCHSTDFLRAPSLSSEASLVDALRLRRHYSIGLHFLRDGARRCLWPRRSASDNVCKVSPCTILVVWSRVVMTGEVVEAVTLSIFRVGSYTFLKPLK